MATISCHSNQSSYPIGTKTQFFVPPAYRCYMWNLVRIGFMFSEEMSFENVDGRRMPAYTISSLMSLRLRWANNLCMFNCQWHFYLCNRGPYVRLSFEPNLLSSWNKVIVIIILLSSKSFCRLRSGCLSWVLLLGLILLVCYQCQLTFPSSALWLLLSPLLVEQDDALHLVSVGSQVLVSPQLIILTYK